MCDLKSLIKDVILLPVGYLIDWLYVCAEDGHNFVQGNINRKARFVYIIVCQFSNSARIFLGS